MTILIDNFFIDMFSVIQGGEESSLHSSLVSKEDEFGDRIWKRFVLADTITTLDSKLLLVKGLKGVKGLANNFSDDIVILCLNNEQSNDITYKQTGSKEHRRKAKE